MKKLELNQMEILEGGVTNCDSGWAAISAGLSGSSVIFAGALVFAAATPIGWFGLGLAAAGFGATMAAC